MRDVMRPDPAQPPEEKHLDDIDDFFSPDEEDFAKALEIEGAVFTQESGATKVESGKLETNPTFEASDAKAILAANEEEAGEGNVPAQNPTQPKGGRASNKVAIQEEESLTPLSDVPITLNIEVARLPINLQKLMDVTSGTILPLDKTLDGKVDLVVKGKKVGVGELLKVGDQLGVRIVQLG